MGLLPVHALPVLTYSLPVLKAKLRKSKMALSSALFLSRVIDVSQLPDVLLMYEALRKPRTTCVVKGSTGMRDLFHVHDGPCQREHDRQLLEYQDKSSEAFPNRWRDPVFQ